MSPTMAERVATLESNYAHLKNDSDLRHLENRSELRGIKKNLSGINIKLAAWSGASGVLTALAVFLLEKLLK